MLNCAIGWRAGLAGALIMAASVAQAAGTPASVFDAYTQAVNSGQIAALRPLVAASIAQPPFARCPPAQSGYDCMISYVDETVIKRHGQLTTNKVDVKGNTVLRVGGAAQRHDEGGRCGPDCRGGPGEGGGRADCGLCVPAR